MDFVKFLNDNSLRKKEIADYLGVVPSIVTDLCSGRKGLSQKNREKLEANDNGWDLSALDDIPRRPEPYVHAKASGSGHNVATVSLGGERDRIVSPQMALIVSRLYFRDYLGDYRGSYFLQIFLIFYLQNQILLLTLHWG